VSVASEPPSVVDVEWSLSHQNTVVRTLATSPIWLSPAKPVLKIVGSRSIGTDPQPTPYRQTSHVRLPVASPCAPLDLTLIKSR
jgi:hypothetical protein